jgi:hypothetical protein
MPYVSKKEAIRLNIPKKTLQTIELPKDKFTITSAKQWLKDNNYANHYWRTTANYIRFMQVMPIIGAEYYSKTLPNGVILVYQTYT